MVNISLDQITGNHNSLFKIAILAGRRAEEISQGAGVLVDNVANEKPTTIALQEILENKIDYKIRKK